MILSLFDKASFSSRSLCSVIPGHTLNPSVNKRFLSTGETGEFASENVGLGLNLWVELTPPRHLSSNRRNCAAHQNLRNVADTGQGDGARCRQQNWRYELG